MIPAQRDVIIVNNKKIHIRGTPAYRARLRRKRKESEPSEFMEIDDSNDEDITEMSMHDKWESDLKILQIHG